jgi:uncharacterized protein
MKRILALDGGGIRGVFTLEVLREIETLLREHYQKLDPARGAKFVLRDHFDFLAGTSTGAIIAACLCWGMSVDRILELYVEQGRQMFERVSWRHPINKLFFSRFASGPLSDILQHLFPEDGGSAILGSPLLRNAEKQNLLMVVVRNHTTGSAWPLTNNPKAKYNQWSRRDCNLRIPLWKLVRASTAAPTFFPPEVIPLQEGVPVESAAAQPPHPEAPTVATSPREVAAQKNPGEGVARQPAAQTEGPENPRDGDAQVFVDGSITPYCNPALIAALTAILPGYRINWTPGPDKIRVVSIGTLAFSSALPVTNPKLWLGYYAKNIPAALLESIAWQQDFLCRCLGECIFGEPIDSEVGDLHVGNPESAPPQGRGWFSYVRYNHTYKKDEMQQILRRHPGLASIDDVNVIPVLRDVGREYALHNVRIEHLL